MLINVDNVVLLLFSELTEAIDMAVEDGDSEAANRLMNNRAELSVNAIRKEVERINKANKREQG